MREIYLSFHETKPSLSHFKTGTEVLHGIETSIAESLSSYPADYLAPLFHELSPEQLKAFEQKSEGKQYMIVLYLLLHTQHLHPHSQQNIFRANRVPERLRCTKKACCQEILLDAQILVAVKTPRWSQTQSVGDVRQPTHSAVFE